MRKWMGSVLLVLIAVGLSTLVNCYLVRSAQSIAWISLPEVFNKFDYKKELEKKYTKTEEARKKIVDSLQLDLNILYKTIQSSSKVTDEMRARFELQRESFLEKKNSLETDTDKMKSEFNSQILTQLNQYVQEYGKEKGFEIILGGEGNGSLMYGAEKTDQTKEVIEYINAKYAGSIH